MEEEKINLNSIYFLSIFDQYRAPRVSLAWSLETGTSLRGHESYHFFSSVDSLIWNVGFMHTLLYSERKKAIPLTGLNPCSYDPSRRH